MGRRIAGIAGLLLSCAWALGCGSSESPSDGGTQADGGGDGGVDGSASTGPYGKCTSAAQCPIMGSRCPGSTKGCLPPCTTPGDCPTADGVSASCENQVCGFKCSVSAPSCPAGMKCLAGVTCGY